MPLIYSNKTHPDFRPTQELDLKMAIIGARLDDIELVPQKCDGTTVYFDARLDGQHLFCVFKTCRTAAMQMVISYVNAYEAGLCTIHRSASQYDWDNKSEIRVWLDGVEPDQWTATISMCLDRDHYSTPAQRALEVMA